MESQIRGGNNIDIKEDELRADCNNNDTDTSANRINQLSDHK